MLQVIQSFFVLGCMSFGGPAAHIGYFHRAFVLEKQWLSEQEYASLVALSQMLPGPGSSQVCFAIGHKKAGIFGALAAFIAFTLPSFLLMALFAYSHAQLAQLPFVESLIKALKLVAVVVVADAVFTMFKSFCRCAETRTIALLSAIVLLIMPYTLVQIALLVFVGGYGFFKLQPDKAEKSNPTKLKLLNRWLVAFVLFFIVSAMPFNSGVLAFFGQYFQAGSLVFGGGHVVLPLLQSMTSDTINADTFLAGYAAAQGIPGPMFTFATFLGFIEYQQSPWIGAFVATLAIFLPGFLLMLGFLTHWQALSGSIKVSGMISAINAAVVGLLLAALYHPIFTSAVSSVVEFSLVILGVLILKVWRFSIMWLLLCAVVGAGLTTVLA